MYLKHMGTPATICPKSHTRSTFLAACHFDGKQGGGWGQRLASAHMSMTANHPCRRLQRKWQCPRVLPVSLELCHHLWQEWGVRRPHGSEDRRVCLVLDCEFFVWHLPPPFVCLFRELDMIITNAWLMSGESKMERVVCFYSSASDTFLDHPECLWSFFQFQMLP